MSAAAVSTAAVSTAAVSTVSLAAPCSVVLPQEANEIAAIATNMKTNFFIFLSFLKICKTILFIKTDAKLRTFFITCKVFYVFFYPRFVTFLQNVDNPQVIKCKQKLNVCLCSHTAVFIRKWRNINVVSDVNVLLQGIVSLIQINLAFRSTFCNFAV